MLAKLKKLGSSDAMLFTLANLIFSFSTYLIALAIPYKLDLKMMADFSATLNIVMILAFVFEFGLATSYLRFNQLYSSTRFINVYYQFFIFSLLLLFYNTFLGKMLGNVFGFENINLNTKYIYFTIFALLSWMFFKNIYLSNKKIKFIFFNALMLLVIRLGFLFYIFSQEGLVSLDSIFLYLFVAPFVLIMFFNMKNNVIYVIKSFDYIKDIRQLGIFKYRLKKLFVYSFLIYLISIIYVYTSRYPLVYLTDQGFTAILAELGYAFSFGGLVLVFTNSIRLYLISKFNISNVDEVLKYITTIKRYKYPFMVVSMLVAALVAGIVNLIKPDYLTHISVIFTFILLLTYFVISYYGMFTLLSKTFNYNKIELWVNIVRLGVVMLSVHLVLGAYPVVGFIIANMSMVIIEYIFANIILNKILKR